MRLTILLFCFLISLSLQAQDQKFRGGFVVGANFSELVGDDITHYFGLNIGPKVTRQLSEKWLLSMELLFSQQGEYILPRFYPDLEYTKINLNYIEIPLQVGYLTRLQEEGYYQWMFNAGFAYTRLLYYRAEAKDMGDVSDQIDFNDRDAFLFQGDGTYFFRSNWGLNIRASLSLHSSELDWTLAARGVFLF